MSYFLSHLPQIQQMTLEHLRLAVLGAGFALLAGVPLGALLMRYAWLRGPVLWVINTVQTIPALALIGFVMVFMGLGPATGITVIFLYGLLPIVRNTYLGLSGVEPALLEAGRGMGMTRLQLLLRVQFPIALPLILDGIRVAAVVGVGTGAVMSLAGAGGLGQIIFAGIDRVQNNMILSGAVMAALLALFVEAVIYLCERLFVSKGLR